MCIPGEYFLSEEPVGINAGRPVLTLPVTNTGDRPIQVGSHYHFFEVNPMLEFDRNAAFGFRLNIPAGSAVRFEPGDTRTVSLVALGGTGRVVGLNGLTCGDTLNAAVRRAALARAASLGFKGVNRP